MAKDLKISNDEVKEIKEPLDLPFIEGNIEVLFGIYAQNLLQAKNSQRKDAVANGLYVQIANSGDAQKMLALTLQELVKNKFNARTKVLAADA